MINKISFKNYKLFKEKQILEIKPITILIGKNNSGKSAVLKLMTVIEGALNSNDDLPIQITNGEIQAGYEFRELIYGKFGRGLGIELFQKNENNEDDILTVEIAVDINKNIPILDYWKLNEAIELNRTEKNTYENEVDEIEYICDFSGIHLNTYSSPERESSGTPFEQKFNLNTDFIGSIREKVKEYYKVTTPASIKSGIDGKNLYDFLIENYLTTDKIYFNLISQWFKDHFEGWELYIDIDNEPYHIELRKGKLEINITETGMGIGQSLPLIIRAFKPCNKETLIIIEEPECHLHPSAHAELAQLFADSLKVDTHKKYLIETHSQNFVLRLRRLIAEGKLNITDLGIYYVEFDEEKNESHLKEIKVDEFGKVDFWPEGIFSETLEETIGIRTAQIMKEDVGRN